MFLNKTYIAISFGPKVDDAKTIVRVVQAEFPMRVICNPELLKIHYVIERED